MAIWIVVTSLHLIRIQSFYWKVVKHALFIYSLISLTSNKISNYTLFPLICWTRNKEIPAVLFTNPLGVVPVALPLTGPQKAQGDAVMRFFVLILNKQRIPLAVEMIFQIACLGTGRAVRTVLCVFLTLRITQLPFTNSKLFCRGCWLCYGGFVLGVLAASSAGRGVGARLPPCVRLYRTVAEKPKTLFLLLHRSLPGKWCLHPTDKLLLRPLGEPVCPSYDPVFLVGSLSSPPQIHTLLLLPFLEHHVSISDYVSGPWEISVCSVSIRAYYRKCGDNLRTSGRCELGSDVWSIIYCTVSGSITMMNLKKNVCKW